MNVYMNVIGYVLNVGKSDNSVNEWHGEWTNVMKDASLAMNLRQNGVIANVKEVYHTVYKILFDFYLYFRKRCFLT